MYTSVVLVQFIINNNEIGNYCELILTEKYGGGGSNSTIKMLSKELIWIS